MLKSWIVSAGTLGKNEDDEYGGLRMSGGAIIDISEDNGWAGCYVTEISDWLYEPDVGKIAITGACGDYLIGNYNGHLIVTQDQLVELGSSIIGALSGNSEALNKMLEPLGIEVGKGE